MAQALINYQHLDLGTVEFKLEDALSLSSIADNSIDLVWSLESCEQFFDKQRFSGWRGVQLIKPARLRQKSFQRDQLKAIVWVEFHMDTGDKSIRE